MAVLDTLIASGGEMSHLLQSIDWANTPLGSLQDWSNSLQNALSICFNSRFPMTVWWGENHLFFYNDAWQPLLGSKHPQALGQPGQAVWTENWDIISPQLQTVLTTGKSTWSDDLLLLIERGSSKEEAYFTCLYSPILSETGAVQGVFTSVTETTQRVLDDRRMATLQSLTVQSSQAATVQQACQLTMQAIANNPDDIPFALLYLIQKNDERLILTTSNANQSATSTDLFRTELSQAERNLSNWLVQHAFHDSQSILINNLKQQFGEFSSPRWHVHPEQALVLPLRAIGRDQSIGVLVAGISPYLPLDRGYQSFLEMVAGYISTEIVSAIAAEEEHSRVTALAENEIRLQEHQKLLQQVTDTVPGILYVYDLTKQQNIYINNQIEELLGYTAAQVQKMGVSLFLQIAHSEDVRRFPEHVRRFNSLQDNEVLENEYRLRNAKGEWRWFSGREIVFSRNADGFPKQILGTAYDITARKQAEEELRREKERFELAASAVDCLIYDWSTETQTVERSEGLTRIFGYQPEETEPTPEWWTEQIHPDDQDYAHTKVIADLGSQNRYSIEYRVRNKAGQYLYVLDQGLVVRDAQGTPVRVVGTTTDISDRKITEKLQQFLLELNDAVRTFDEPQDIAWTVVQKVGTYFDVNHCSYCELDIQQECVTFTRNFSRDQGNTLNKHRIEDLGFQLTSLLHRGIIIAIDDVQKDKRTIPYQSAFSAVNTRSLLCVPVFQQNHNVALFILQSSEPRNWSSEELALMEEIAERTWLAIDKARTEQALRQSEDRFQRLATNVPGVICRYLVQSDGSEAMPYISPSCRNLFGLDESTIQADIITLWDMIDPEDIQSLREIITVSAQTQQPIHWEGRFVLPSERTKWIQFVARPEKQLAGAVLWDGLLTDITGTKEVEIEREQLLLRAQQYATQLRGLTEAALAMNSVLSVEEVLQAITEQAQSIVGVNLAVTSLVENQNWKQAIHTRYLSDQYKNWANSAAKLDGSGIYAEVCSRNQPLRLTQAELEAHPNYQRLKETIGINPPLNGWLAAPLTGRNGQNIGLIQLSDKNDGEFTESDEAILVQLAQMASVAIENTRLYEAEQNARTQAEAANKIKDEFLAVLSHELRSPLNPILGWARLMRNRKLDEHTISCALETIERNAKLQTQLIEDLLDVSRILQGKMSLSISPVDLTATVDAALETVRLAAEAKSIQIHKLVEPKAMMVLGDPNRLQQVVWNLLSNAVKFTPVGGAIEIKLTRSDAQAQIRVTDTGKGIEPNFIPYVFEYFRQEDGATTRKFGGLGLGLAIVRHIVEQHGGTIHAASAGEGKGATFLVLLPLLKRSKDTVIATERDLSAMAYIDPTALKNCRALVADDDNDSRDLVVFVLEQAGASVTSVTSGVNALQAISQADFDILISDIGMPEVDGYMLMRQVRSRYLHRHRQIPAIALTAYAGEFNQQQALSAGFQAHLSKPVEPAELIQSVTRLLNEENSRSQEV